MASFETAYKASHSNDKNYFNFNFNHFRNYFFEIPGVGVKDVRDKPKIESEKKYISRNSK